MKRVMMDVLDSSCIRSLQRQFIEARTGIRCSGDANTKNKEETADKMRDYMELKEKDVGNKTCRDWGLSRKSTSALEYTKVERRPQS